MDSPIYAAAVKNRDASRARFVGFYPDGSAKDADALSYGWVSCADTARLIRAALAKAFPGVKFFVRSHTYAGGASIDVYFDGRLGDMTWTRIDSFDNPYGDPVPYDQVDHSTGRWAPVRKPGMPLLRDVSKVLAPFAGGRFDGMIDMAYSVRSWLNPDGSATLADSPGTVGSAGVDPAYDLPAKDPRAVKVRFGADHVFANDYLPYDVRSKAG